MWMLRRARAAQRAGEFHCQAAGSNRRVREPLLPSLASRPSLASLRVAACVAIIAPALAGCMEVAALSSPKRLFTVEQELESLRPALESGPVWTEFYALRHEPSRQKMYRNSIIAARMYAIDLEYTEYETKLGTEDRITSFGAKALQVVLNTWSTLSGSLGTKTTLSALGIAAGDLESAYNDKILLTKLMQDLQRSMRTARHRVRAYIRNRLGCSIDTYPFAMAMSDIETYYRAGTLTTGLKQLTQTVAKAESQTNQTSEVSGPTAASPAKNAVAKMIAADAEAQAKRAEANCSLERGRR